MKKNLSGWLCGLLLALGAARAGHAQQLALYSQYMNNQFLLNPAVAGTESFIDVKVSYRAQWTGLEGAPRTFYASANSSLGSLQSQGSRTKYDWQRGFHSIGGIVYTDVTGPTRRTGLYGAYSYNLALSRTLRLAMGVSVGMQQFSVDGAMLQFHSGYIASSQASRVPDATVGIWLYDNNFFLGGSSAQILGNQLDIAYSPTNQLVYSNKLERHYFVTGGVRVPLSDDFTLVPSALLRIMPPAPVSVDLNAKLKYRDILYLGASYRVKDSVVGILGIGLGELGWLSYSYDATSSELSGYQGGSHEVLLSLQFNKKKRVVCPGGFW